MGLLDALAYELNQFMQSMPGLLPTFLYLAVVGIPVTLVHELGHALAARRLLGDVDVSVSVGTAGKLMDVQLGKLALTVNALSHPSRAAGAAEFDDSRATARDVALIALAGPAMSLAGALLTGWALSMAPLDGVVHDVLWTATASGVFGVLNLVPIKLQERRGGPTVRTDGRVMLEALRVVHALR